MLPRGCPFRRSLFVVCMTPDKEEAMKYMLLIHQGSAPTPYDQEAWGRLSEDEQQAVYADYQALNQTPGVSPGLQLRPPETATTTAPR